MNSFKSVTKQRFINCSMISKNFCQAPWKMPLNISVMSPNSLYGARRKKTWSTIWRQSRKTNHRDMATTQQMTIFDDKLWLSKTLQAYMIRIRLCFRTAYGSHNQAVNPNDSTTNLTVLFLHPNEYENLFNFQLSLIFLPIWYNWTFSIQYAIQNILNGWNQ